jgi:hypothetical protein
MDPTEWLNKTVPSFCSLSASERAAIKDFAVLWTIYEGRVLDTRGDVDKIKYTTKKLKSQGRLSLDNPLRFAIRDFTRRYFDGFELTSAFHDLLLSSKDCPYVENVLRDNTNDEVAILSAILIIIYRLRNNFFHGTKWSYEAIDQFDNFHNANKILMAVVDMRLRDPHSGGIGRQ